MSIISKRKHNQHKKDTYQKDAVVIAEPVDDVVSSDDSRYFHCPTCGLVVQIGDESCRNCGTMFDSSGDTISNPAADKVRYFYRKHKAAVLVVAALLIGGTGVSKGIDIATQIMVPAVTGMPAVEAAETLEEAGFDSEDVYFYDENASLSESDIEKGEYDFDFFYTFQKEYPISNTFWLSTRAVNLPIEGKKNLVIDFNGSSLYFNGWTMPIWWVWSAT